MAFMSEASCSCSLLRVIIDTFFCFCASALPWSTASALSGLWRIDAIGPPSEACALESATVLLLLRLDLVDVAQAQNMMITIKRRFARVMRAAVASTLSGRENIEDELHALLAPGDQHG